MKRLLSVTLLLIIFCVSGFSAFASNELATVNLNGAQLNFDVSAQIINGRTLVPLRAIFEGIGAKVEWEDATQTVTATKGETTVSMTIGLNNFTVNNETKTLDVPPQLIDSRTLVPARAVAESFGATIEWDDATNTVSITDETVCNYGELLTTTYNRSMISLSSVTSKFNMHAAVRMNANEINTYVDADIKTNKDIINNITTSVEATVSMADGHNGVEADVTAKEVEGVPTLYMTPRLEHGDAVPTQKTIESINQVADFDFIAGNIFDLGDTKVVKDEGDLVKYVVTVKGQDILKLVEVSKVNNILPADTGLDIVLNNIKNYHTVDIEVWIDKENHFVVQTAFDLAPVMNEVFAETGMNTGAAAGEFKVEVYVEKQIYSIYGS